MKYISYITIVLIGVINICCTAKNSENKETIKNSSLDNYKVTSTTNYSDEAVTIVTEDKAELSAVYFFNKDRRNTPEPTVVLIHQFKQDKNQWNQQYIDILLSKDFKVLIFDIRGHGKSSPYDGDLTELLTDKSKAPLDITAVINWLKNDKGVDTSRIGVVGTSIGGNLALYAALNLGVKVPISISNSKKTFEIFTGYNEMMMGRPFFPKIKNALLICGNKDGDTESGQKWIYDNFCDDPREFKVYDSDKHGYFLIQAYPEINTLITDWLKKYL
jgi:pimeloyl-ACP methyl ester carboxylesterase